MENQKERISSPFCPNVSVDCVLLGINEDKLSVLLVERKLLENNAVGYKLPGSLIYETEELDDAALRVMKEAVGHTQMSLRQFHTFGSVARTAKKEDVLWLEKESHTKVTRIVTVVYLALSKKGKTVNNLDKNETMRWFPVEDLPDLPFDHKSIVEESVNEIRNWVEREPAIIYEYLPSKFTAFQLRRTYEIIYNKKFDVRNFQKKMNLLGYIVPTDEMEVGVPHRAARYYRFNKIRYNKLRSSLNK